MSVADFKILFEMLDEKEKQIKKIEIETRLMKNEIMRKTNGLLVYSRVYAKLSVEEFSVEVSGEGFEASNIRKLDYMADDVIFCFSFNEREFRVKFAKNITCIEECYFNEEEIDLFKVFIVDGCSYKLIGKDIRLVEIGNIIEKWIDENR
ncbi:MAG: hypothetical protein ACRC5T_09805 [Cetobacterium sp.]